MPDTRPAAEFDEDDPPVVGLPPRPEDLWTEPTPSDLMGARMLNMFGIFTPLANLGMRQVSPPDMRWTGVLVGAVLWLIAALLYAGGSFTFSKVVFGVYYALVVLGLLHPRWPEAVLRVWTRFGEGIGKVMAVPMFGLMFYLAVTPVALLMRALGKDPLARRAEQSDSYWIDRESLPTDRFDRQF